MAGRADCRALRQHFFRKRRFNGGLTGRNLHAARYHKVRVGDCGGKSAEIRNTSYLVLVDKILRRGYSKELTSIEKLDLVPFE